MKACYLPFIVQGNRTLQNRGFANSAVVKTWTITAGIEKESQHITQTIHKTVNIMGGIQAAKCEGANQHSYQQFLVVIIQICKGDSGHHSYKMNTHYDSSQWLIICHWHYDNAADTPTEIFHFVQLCNVFRSCQMLSCAENNLHQLWHITITSPAFSKFQSVPKRL